MIDTETGASRQIADQPGYSLVAIGGGQLLWAAGDDPYYVEPPLLSDVTTGLTSTPAGWGAVVDPLTAAASRYPEAVGDQWLIVRQTGNHYNLPGYLNWRTGDWLIVDPGPETSWANLDGPTLLEPICASFKRQHYSYETTENFGWKPFNVARSYVAFQHGNRVLAGRCGSTRTRSLFRYSQDKCRGCLDGVRTHPSLSASRPVWMGPAKRARLFAYLPRKRRTVTLARMRRGDSFVWITQTRDRIFVQLRDSRVYWLPAPS